MIWLVTGTSLLLVLVTCEAQTTCLVCEDVALYSTDSRGDNFKETSAQRGARVRKYVEKNNKDLGLWDLDRFEQSCALAKPVTCPSSTKCMKVDSHYQMGPPLTDGYLTVDVHLHYSQCASEPFDPTSLAENCTAKTGAERDDCVCALGVAQCESHEFENFIKKEAGVDGLSSDGCTAKCCDSEEGCQPDYLKPQTVYTANYNTNTAPWSSAGDSLISDRSTNPDAYTDGLNDYLYGIDGFVVAKLVGNVAKLDGKLPVTSQYYVSTDKEAADNFSEQIDSYVYNPSSGTTKMSSVLMLVAAVTVKMFA